ncbi:MAG: hypothetical protein JO303_08595 [Caulobacteraceae bacterium]|nr:hypothetical protein [Caulobacteraceae bacterium]
MNAAVLAAPNVFVQYECERNQAAPAEPAQSLFETYARFHEDLIVEALLRGALSLQGRGLESIGYLDIGARHPIEHSTTYLLYRKWGASGVLASADPAAREALSRVRERDVVVEPGAWEALAGRRIDLLSIEAADAGALLALLEAPPVAALRPVVILLAPGDAAVEAGLAARLQAQGYALAGRTEASLIFLDPAAAGAGDARARINSFDVFDTLIARRCIEPHRIFDQIEAACSLAGFAAARRAAETAVAAGPYVLADIYARLAQDLGLPAAEGERLMALEIEAELAAVMPIAENLAQVRDGDLLISDMYLGEEVIRRLLAKAGLDKTVGLSVSAHGKRSGEVWPKLKAEFHVGRHLGDNDHADVVMPARFGVRGVKSDVHAPSQVEAWCLNLGLRDMAELLREARLTSWSTEGLTRRLQLAQLQLNFPILLLSSVALMRLARETGASHLLFSSRDCRMWLGLHQALAGKTGQAEAPADYFYTSRRARTEASPGYLAYARERLGERGLVVDVCGSGWSTQVLLDRLGLTGRELFFVHQIATPTAYERKIPTPDTGRVHALVEPTETGVNNMVLELCNTAAHASVQGVTPMAGAWTPRFEPDPRPASILRLAEAQARWFETAAGLVPRADLSRTLSLPTSDIAQLVLELYRKLCQEPAPIHLFADSHLAEDRETMRAMGLGG